MDEDREQLLHQLIIQQGRVQALFAAAPIGIAFVDADLRYVQVNDTMARMDGVAAEQHVGRTPREVVPSLSAPIELVLRQVLETGASIVNHEISGSVPGSDETHHWLANCYPVESEGGRIRGVGLAVMEITERKRAEKSLEDLLAREQAAREEAEAASHAKDEFLSTVSHELRTPLSAMLGWVRLLGSGKLDAAAADRAIEAIARSARSQAQLVEDLLDVSRITAGRLRIDVRAIDLTVPIEQAVEAVRPAAEAKGIEITTDLDASLGPVRADPDRLQQVVWNLLSNAVKFTPSGGRALVRLARVDPFVEITVRDTGDGISPEFLPYVFERFRQADGSSSRAYGGLGLGLAIARHLVEVHGGTVHAESEGKGRGATFVVRLPVPAMRIDVAEDGAAREEPVQ